MDVRELRYFVSAMRHGNLQAAARENFVTQPAVSIQLRKLEAELGEKLYVRRGRRIVPTSAGSLLLAEAEEIVRRVNALASRVEDARAVRRGVLKMGSIDAASVYVLPNVFRAYRRKYPGIDIQVIVSDSQSLLSALGAGAIELAIVTLPLSGESYRIVPVYEDRMALVVHPRHDLVRLRSPKDVLRRVAEIGLITYPARSTTRRLIEKVFMDNGLTLRVSMEMSSPEAIKKLAEAGLGPTILPARVVSDEVRAGTLRIIPTGKIRFLRMLGAVFEDRGAISPPAAAFLGMLEKRIVRRRTRNAVRKRAR